MTTVTVHPLGVAAFALRANGKVLSYDDLRAVLPRNLLPAPGLNTYALRSMAHDAAFTFERRSAA